jgi:predicted permease
VLLFAFGTTLLVGVVVGLAPALRVRSFDLYAAFKSGGRTAGGTHRFPVGRMLVAAQMAITLVLVTSAVLFTRTLKNFLTIDAGFNRERVVTARIDPRAAGYTYAELPDVHRRLLEAAKRIPGVQSASLSLLGLAAGAVRTSGFTVQGGLPANGQRPAQENTVSPGYFGTVGIPLLRGRDFTWFDDTTHQKVGIVSEAFAKKFFGTTDVVGKHFGYGDPTCEIIGVAADARVNGLKDKPPAIVYRSLTQAPKEYITTIDVRTSGSTDAAVGGLRRAIAGVDNKLPVREVVALGPFVERGLTRERLVARLASSFGFFGLLLAVVGLYGVISYSVSRRTREVGVRMALGATPGAVSWLVMRDSLTLVMIGVALGAALWFPTLSLTRSLLYGVSAHDPVFLILSIVVLVLAGAVASLLPARRASRIDPIEAIRAE